MVNVLLIVFRGIAYLFSMMPRIVQFQLGRMLGFILRRMGFKRQVVRTNLGYAYPSDFRTQARLFNESYTHFGNLILEIFLVLGPLKRFILKNVDLIGHENWLAAKNQGRGVLFLSSHVGNWEIMAAGGAVLGDMDLMLVTKKVKPQWLHDAIEAGRARCGVSATYEPKTAKDVLKHLKRGGTVGFVLDQFAGPPVGVRVPVFGKPVGTHLALATFAKRSGACVLPVVNYRCPNGRWVIDIKPPIDWKNHPDSHFELAQNTARYAVQVEADILAHPEQWLWVHRRFKGDLSPLRPGEWASARTRG